MSAPRLSVFQRRLQEHETIMLSNDTSGFCEQASSSSGDTGSYEFQHNNGGDQACDNDRFVRMYGGGAALTDNSTGITGTPHDVGTAKISVVPAERLIQPGPVTTTLHNEFARPFTDLPNDTCATTRELETNFLNANRFKPYTNSTPTTKTVIYSRSLKAYYTRHGEDDRSQLLTSVDLEPFKEVGHTLAVDNTKSYIRLCAFDLDCMCRRNFGSQHLGETLANSIRVNLESMLSKITDQRQISCVVWKKACGYHLYTNVSLSMPFHLELGERLNAEFRHHGVIIEVPSRMPLPYSAKTSGEPYRPLLFGQPSVPLLGSNPYYDRYEFKPTLSRDQEFVMVEMDTRIGPLYLIGGRSTVKKVDAPKLSVVTAIRFDQTASFLKPLQEYITHINTSALSINGGGVSDGQYTVQDGPEEIEALLNTDKFKTFIETFNSTHFNEKTQTAATVIPDYSRFVQISAIDKGAMYLQHYVVALYKIMRPINDEVFRQLLTFIYKRVRETDPTVARLIEKYDHHTFTGYNDPYDSILKMLSFIYIQELRLDTTLETHINEMMCSSLNVQSVNSWSAEYRSIRETASKEKKKFLALDTYISIMSRMKYLMHYNQTWYMYTNEGYHKSTAINAIPCISMWVHLDDSAKRYIESQASLFAEPNMWSTCDFMFATSVGVFNSITGLYTAKLPLLRFTKSRNYAVWEPEKPLTMYAEQNKDILALSETAKRFADIVYDRITELFLHYQIIPAMIQMPRVYNVDDLKLVRFFELFEDHDKIDAAHFLVDYYPVDPKFIYLIMYLYTIYDLGTLLNYSKLVDSVFKYKTNVTGEDWVAMFQPKLDRVTVDVDVSDHMATLLSMRGEDLDGIITKDFCLYTVLISVCMIKCFSFRLLVEAFGVQKLPVCANKERIPEQYRDVEYQTTLDCYKRILDQTLKTVYGDELTVFEKALARMTVQLGMSACFDPETTRELLNMVSAVYVPRNILKKMMILTGPQNTGKSFFCDLIMLLSAPCVGRFQDIRQAVERANITTKTNVTIINETSVINPHHMKSVTGNDGESAQVFYSQNYEMQKFQSLIYGATNGVIVFKDCDKKMYNIDRTTVERIHAITLNGQQVYESEEKNRNDSLFMMVAKSRFFAGVINEQQETSARALGWLAYVTYYHRRDKNNKPILNTTNPDVLAYQQRVYYHNNSLYAFLVQSGITEEPGFYIDQRSLIATVRRSIEDKVHARTITTFSDFESQYNAHYNVKLKQLSNIDGLQYTALVDHIKTTMETVKCEGQHITEAELESRLKVYGTQLNRSNAREYFKRKNPRFDHNRRLFTDVKFVHDTTDSYDGNEFTDSRDSSSGGGGNNGLLYPTTFVTESV